jgi:putative peptide zinc metalloprotease protein
VLCLASFAVVTLPADVALLTRAVHGLGPDPSVAENRDALTVLVVLAGVHVLRAVTRWRTRLR